MPDPTTDPTAPGPAAELRRERVALTISALASAVLGVVALLAGAVLGSAVILFDGMYTLAGIALVGVSALASRAAARSPDQRYPFGRHAATPLAVAMQGAALIATLVYAVADAIGTLLGGGTDTDPLWLVIYGAVAAVLSALVARWLRVRAPSSALVDAEVVSWRAGAGVSAAVVAGGLAGLVLGNTGHDTAAGYVDPVLLLLVVVLITPMPVRLIREGMHELLEGVPPVPVATEVDRAIAAARAELGLALPDPAVRATKLGRRLYVEVDFVVRPGDWTVDEEDAVRRAVVAQIRRLPFDVWASVELTTEPMH